MNDGWSPEEFIRRREYADANATSIYDWWDWFERPEALERAKRPGLLVRWWYWRMERKSRKARTV